MAASLHWHSGFERPTVISVSDCMDLKAFLHLRKNDVSSLGKLIDEFIVALGYQSPNAVQSVFELRALFLGLNETQSSLLNRL